MGVVVVDDRQGLAQNMHQHLQVPERFGSSASRLRVVLLGEADMGHNMRALSALRY